MSHAAKEGAVIYSGAFVGPLLWPYVLLHWCLIPAHNSGLYWILLFSRSPAVMSSICLCLNYNHLFLHSFCLCFLMSVFQAFLCPSFCLSCFPPCLRVFLVSFSFFSFLTSVCLQFLLFFPLSTNLKACRSPKLKQEERKRRFSLNKKLLFLCMSMLTLCTWYVCWHFTNIF